MASKKWKHHRGSSINSSYIGSPLAEILALPSNAACTLNERTNERMKHCSLRRMQEFRRRDHGQKWSKSGSKKGREREKVGKQQLLALPAPAFLLFSTLTFLYVFFFLFIFLSVFIHLSIYLSIFIPSWSI